MLTPPATLGSPLPRHPTRCRQTGMFLPWEDEDHDGRGAGGSAKVTEGLMGSDGVTPITLEPGEYVIGGEAFGSTPDYYVYAAEHTAAEGVFWSEGRYLSGSSLSFPTVVTPGTTDSSSWFGPNFLMRE